MATGKHTYVVTLPDDRTVKRTTYRVYTHMLALQASDGSWSGYSFHGSLQAAERELRSGISSKFREIKDRRILPVPQPE